MNAMLKQKVAGMETMKPFVLFSIVLVQWLASVPTMAQTNAFNFGSLNIRSGTSVLFRSTIGPVTDLFGCIVSVGNELYLYCQPLEFPPLVNLIRTSQWSLAVTSEYNPEECESPSLNLGEYGYPGLWIASQIEPLSGNREICWKRKPLVPPGEGDHPQMRPGRSCSTGGRNSLFEVRVYEKRELVASVKDKIRLRTSTSETSLNGVLRFWKYPMNGVVDGMAVDRMSGQT